MRVRLSKMHGGNSYVFTHDDPDEPTLTLERDGLWGLSQRTLDLIARTIMAAAIIGLIWLFA